MELISTAFDDCDPIPGKYGYEASNVNPPLSFEDVPDDAESLALVMDDPDAVEPAGQVWDHWVVWNVDPDVGEIMEGWVASDAVEGQNDYGENEYGGPNPPDGRHSYHFRLYALDTELGLTPGSSKEEFKHAIEGTVIETAELEGTYSL